MLQIQKIDTFAGHRDGVYALEQSNDPSVFYSAGADGMVVRWDLARPDLGELIAQIPASVYALAHDAHTQLLWVGQNFDGIHLLNPATKKEEASLQITGSQVFDIQIFDNLVLVACGDGTVIVIDRLAFAVRKHIKASEASARCIAINVHTQEFAVGYSDASIRVFALADFSLRYHFTAHQNSVFTVRYSPDYRFLLSGSRDARLKIWNVWDNYALEHEVVAHLFAINHIAYSPDNQWFATCSMDKSIKIWEAETFKLRKVIDKARHAGHGTSVNRLLWSNYQNLLLSGSDDRRISVWGVG